MENCQVTNPAGLLFSRINYWYRRFVGRIPTIYVIIGVGALVRLPDLTAPLWYDEVFSARVTALPLPRLLNATAGDVHPPGYYLFLKGWCLLFSNSELALRVPSMLAGIALIYLVYRLASALSLTHPACVGASVITALAPFQVYYSQEARPYAVVMAALVLAALGLVERRWWWFIIGILGALYCNTMALFVVIGLGLAGLWLARNDRRYWFSIGAIGLGYLPALLMVLTQAGNVSNGYWILPPFSPGKLISVIDDLLFFSPQTPFVFASATLTAFAVYLILSRFSLPAVLDSPALYSLYSAGVIPICLAAIVSMLWTPVLLSRAMAGAAPFLYLLISWAVTQDKLTARMWFAGAGLVMAAVLLGGIFTNHMGRVDWLAGNDTIQPGDAVYHTSLGSYLPYQYYWPNNPHYLMPQTHSIANDLTPQTKKALSIDSAEIPLDNVICQTPARRWVLGLTLSALNTPADAETITALQTQYAPYRVKHAQTVFSDGGLYVVNCPAALQSTQNQTIPQNSQSTPRK